MSPFSPRSNAMFSPAVLVSLVLLSVGAVARAAPECSAQVRPAATLLVPYFQADLDNAAGRSTLFAVGNADDQPVLVHVTLWTDWAKPTLSFDIRIPADGVQTVSVKNIFSGVLPTTDGAGFPDCATPLAKPPLGPAELARLRARHTGLADPDDGQCYGSTRGGPGIATGFLTVDAMNACPTSVNAHPGNGGYFQAGGTGLASNANVLYGDFFLLDDANNFAQGNAALHLVADAQQHAQGSFYSLDLPIASNDGRAPLGRRHRTRFLAGGSFDGGTDLIVFAAPSTHPGFGGVPCGQRVSDVDPCQFLRFTTRPESGAPTTEINRSPLLEHTAIYSLADDGSGDVDPGAPFGVIDVHNFELGGCLQIPSELSELGAWVMPLYSAVGRLSVGMDSIRLEPDCQ